MPTGLLSRLKSKEGLPRPGARTQRVVLIFFFAVFYVLSTSYLLLTWGTAAAMVASSGSPPSIGTTRRGITSRVMVEG